MLLRILALFSSRYTTILAEEIFVGNHSCTVTNDCTGLRYCDPDWGCIVSLDKLCQIILAVFGTLLFICGSVCVYMWIRCVLRDRNIASAAQHDPSIPLNNHSLTQSVVGIHTRRSNLMNNSGSSSADYSEPVYPDEMNYVANTSDNVSEPATVSFNEEVTTF